MNALPDPTRHGTTRGRAQAALLVLTLLLALAAPALAQGIDRAPKPVQDNPAKAAQAATADYDDEFGPPPAPMPDPLEPLNRAFFTFNDKFYFYVLKPVSHGYGLVVPEPLRLGIHNAYENVLFPVRFANSLLQFNFRKAGSELARFILNTVFGVGGLFDVAKERPGLHQQVADFGQTLGVWGIGHGFYFVIPFLGPSSFRDGVGRVGDLAFSPWTYVTQPFTKAPWYWSWIPRIASSVNDASLHQGEYEAFKNAAVEPYAAMRDAYAQYRRELVTQGSSQTKTGW